MERAKGIEPLSLAWKAKAQPLYQARWLGSAAFASFEPPLPRTGSPIARSLSLAMLADPNWLQRRDLNPRPTGYEPVELPDCSTLQIIV